MFVRPYTLIGVSPRDTPYRTTLPGPCRWDTAQQARLAVFAWITRYNTRRHSYCGQQSPNTYENTSTAATLQPAA